MHNPTIVMADVETTGVGPKDRIVELAYAVLVEHEPGKIRIERMVRSLIDPEMPIPPAASGVHHITDDMVADAPTLDEFLLVVSDPVKTPVIFCAHNAPFDARFLAPVFPNIVGTVDTLRLARKLLPGMDSYKLDTLRYALGLYKGTAHRADEDVRSTVELLQILLDKAGTGIQGLIGMQAAPILLIHWPFGKFRGNAIADTAKTEDGLGYIRWLIKDAQKKGKPLDGDLAFTLQKALKGEL